MLFDLLFVAAQARLMSLVVVVAVVGATTIVNCCVFKDSERALAAINCR